MSTDLVALMRQADPVDDVEQARITGAHDDLLFATILQRRETTMALDHKPASKQARPVRPSRRTGWLVASVAFAAAIVVIGSLALFSSTTDSEPPAGSAIGVTLEGEVDDAALEAFAVVESTYVAFNLGDADAYLGLGLTDDDQIPLVRSMFAAGAQVTVERCESLGYGTDWVNAFDRIGTGTGLNTSVGDGYLIHCEVARTDDFTGAAGLTERTGEDWVIDNGRIVSATGIPLNEVDIVGYAADFRSWMEDKHPDVAATITYINLFAWPDEASMPTAIEYVEEFVADSTDW